MFRPPMLNETDGSVEASTAAAQGNAAAASQATSAGNIKGAASKSSCCKARCICR